MKKIVGPTILIVIVGTFVFLAIRSASTLTEANQDLAFEASVINIQATQHVKVDCPKLNEFQPTTDVFRVKFDRIVMIWSENGTGRGLILPTDSVDLRIDTGIKYLSMKSLVGMGTITFQYNASFLSVCDSSRIPTISSFEWSKN